MTEGMEIQEAVEEPKETREVSEESKRVDAATFEPEAVIEREMDYETAEAVEKAFVEVVQESSADEVTPTPITFSKEIGETIDEGEEASITIEKAAESVKDTGAGDLLGQLDGLGDDSQAENELVMRDPDGSDGSLEIDLGGLETTVDIREPTDISDGYGPDGMKDANRGDDIGYQGGEPADGLETPGGDMPGGLDGDLPGGIDGMPGGLDGELPGGMGGVYAWRNGRGFFRQ